MIYSLLSRHRTVVLAEALHRCTNVAPLVGCILMSSPLELHFFFLFLEIGSNRPTSDRQNGIGRLSVFFNTIHAHTHTYGSVDADRLGIAYNITTA